MVAADLTRLTHTDNSDDDTAVRPRLASGSPSSAMSVYPRICYSILPPLLFFTFQVTLKNVYRKNLAKCLAFYIFIYF